jgi:small subunit ribosomal protein S6e
MVDFKAVIGDPKSKKTYQQAVTGHHANSLLGKKVGDEIDGIFVGLPGYRLKITGGTDKDGFAMRPDVPGPARRKVLVARSLGYHPDREGVRSRRTLRGNAVSPDVVQINMKVVGSGPRPISELVAAAPAGEKKDEPKQRPPAKR